LTFAVRVEYYGVGPCNVGDGTIRLSQHLFERAPASFHGVRAFPTGN
jgi:hypothetical protein